VNDDEGGRATESTAVDRILGRAATPARGTPLGRYLVLEQIGAGGLGVVLAAYDPQLHRKVALKLLRTAHSMATEEAREPVLREARALARVVHPNIVTVYDAGFEADDLFVVMELVEGHDLRGWLRDRERSLAEILEVFLQAGRGLAGAHDAGLVHRDFKPDNVLVGNDGRVRVADFGLARVLAGTAADGVEGPPSADLTTTRTGALVGTPAYMAPEQHASARVDARADQFAFCVALHEALHGARPFDGATYDALVDNLRSGRRRAAATAARRPVPPWIQAAIDRGLSRDPDARFPSMRELLAALGADPAAARRRRLRVGLAAAATVALAAAGLAGVRGLDDRPRLCRSAPAELAAAWGPAARAAVERAFLASGKPYAAEVLATVTARLDAYGAGWSSMRTEACEATHHRGTQSATLLDLRMRCLDGRLAALDAAARVLASADGAALEKAMAVAGELPPIAACADAEALGAVGAPPAEARSRVDALAARLAEATALRRAGRHAAALASAAPVAEAARALGHRPLLAEALLERGAIEEKLVRLRQAELTLREALLVAAAARDGEALARVAVQLAGVVGNGLLRDGDLAALRPFVEAALAAAPRGDVTRGTWLAVQGHSALRLGRSAEAASHYEAALAARERALPAGDPAIANALALLGRARTESGDGASARPLLERALAIVEAAFGRSHPEVAPVLHDLADAVAAGGDHAEARALHQRALAVRELSLAPDNPLIATSAVHVGIVLLRAGDAARAGDLFARAIAINEAFYGPDHVAVAPQLLNLGIVHARTGRLAEAERAYRRALAIFERTYGPEHPSVGAALTNIGNVHLKQGRYADAIPLFERDLAIAVARQGPDHPDVALAHLNLGEAFEPLGRVRDARRALERARAIYLRTPGNDYELAHVELGLGRLELAAGRRRTAIPYLERAATLWEAGGFDPAKVTEARVLLARARGR
jgi:tetratricopeptide (TPR) repeat protein